MSSRTLAAIAIAAMLPVLANPAVAGEVALEPRTPWTIDYADASCALRRSFGPAEDTLILEMRKFSPISDIQYMVGSGEFGLKSRRSLDDIKVRYIPDAKAMDTGHGFGMDFDSGLKGATFSSNMPKPLREQLEEQAGNAAAVIGLVDITARESEVTGLEIENLFRDDLVLQTGSMGPPMQAMRECLDELLIHWGIDAEAHRNLRRAVTPLDMERWVRPIVAAYPSSMVARGQQAVLRVRLNVSPEGGATDCSMQARIGQQEFADTACDLLLEHARFEPALDAALQPIASYYVLSMIYALN